MKKNINIKNLITIIEGMEINHFDDLTKLKPLLINDILDWQDKVKLSKERYFKNIIFRNNISEIIIISWLPGQHTRLHSHPDNGCILKVLRGSLNEITKNNNIISEKTVSEGNTSIMHNNFGQHIISNITDEIAVSLHIYSPPNFYK